MGIKIDGIVCALPRETEYNENLNWINPALREKLIQTIGINKRHIAPADQKLSKYALEASRSLFKNLELSIADIGIFILITQTPDQKIPNTAALLASELGLPTNTLVLEVNSGCSGYVQGLHLAEQLIQSKNDKKALLICGDLSSHLLQPYDTGTIPLFSDGLAATIISHSSSSHTRYDFGNKNTDHEAIALMKVSDHDEFLKLDGHKILTFGLQTVVPGVRDFLEKSDSNQFISHYFFHQASKIINVSIQKKLNIDLSKCPESLSSFGNTSSATIPLTMCLSPELTQKSHTILLCGFGTGLAWSCAMLEVSAIQYLAVELV